MPAAVVGPSRSVGENVGSFTDGSIPAAHLARNCADYGFVVGTLSGDPGAIFLAAVAVGAKCVLLAVGGLGVKVGTTGVFVAVDGFGVTVGRTGVSVAAGGVLTGFGDAVAGATGESIGDTRGTGVSDATGVAGKSTGGPGGVHSAGAADGVGTVGAVATAVASEIVGKGVDAVVAGSGGS